VAVEPRHHALPQTQVGFYAVYLPPGYDEASSAATRYPLCLILHGSGSTETAHGDLANAVGREGVIYVAPRAPYPNHGVFFEDKKPGWTAWPQWPEAWGPPDGPAFPSADVEKLAVERLYTDFIASCVADARRRYRADPKAAVLVGHSQGAAFAHLFALHRPELVRAYFAYAGYYEGTTKDEFAAFTLKKFGIAPSIAHCEGDAVVPVAQARDLHADLTKHDVPHEALLLPGGDHGLVSKILRAAHAFVARHCRGEELPPLEGKLEVIQVEPSSQAARAGLQVGDLLTSYAGKPLAEADDLRAAIAGLAAGTDPVRLVWRRGEQEHEASVLPGRLGVGLADR
jgi:predicted esterase